jgi:glutamine synthetase
MDDSINKAISQMLEKLKSEYGLKPQVGIELEFYILPHADDLKIEECTIIKERGNGQYEFQLAHTCDIDFLINLYFRVRNRVIAFAKENGRRISFKPKPFLDDYGSALHLHLSLLDENENNVFACGDINKNEYLREVIAGILDLTPEAMGLVFQEGDFKRLDHRFMAPINLSWGGNNRTTLVRIPDVGNNKENRRVEFRLFGADADIRLSVLFLLIAVYHGLSSKPACSERIYGNAYDSQYNLQPLPKNLEIAVDIFKGRGILKHYLTDLIKDE